MLEAGGRGWRLEVGGGRDRSDGVLEWWINGLGGLHNVFSFSFYYARPHIASDAIWGKIVLKRFACVSGLFAIG
jgi:hypothetical protein